MLTLDGQRCNNAALIRGLFLIESSEATPFRGRIKLSTPANEGNDMARPKVLADDMVELKTSYPAADNAVLNTLARATGEGKASHLRCALCRYLATFDLANHTATSVVTHPITKEQER